eukprot:CAMPEP_0182445470 /NCGR_PEP_ID=MMETSP1172-20130603/3580_1 /TAXON_ID=708627 /ORGANISM="Timspurckia oligopyrenoides, Strain CCMP3278" /LENGTH=237 /DNA_ID=CAMNT_0024641247 /DNA_START=43 /DNA_END=756 /DNA_ORIENTATION=+
MGIKALRTEVLQTKEVIKHGVPHETSSKFFLFGWDRNVKIPVDHFHDCYGVAIFAEYSVALGIGAVHGVGLMMKKLKKGTPEEFWSAPVPFAINGAEGGATVGFTKTDFIMFFTTPEQMKMFELHSEVKVTASIMGSSSNTEMHFADTTKEGVAERVDFSVLGDGSASTGFLYANAKGFMISAALSESVMKIENNKFHAAYGQGATASAVLNGELGLHDAYSDIDMAKVYTLMNKKL